MEALLVVLAADLLVVLVTGSGSLLGMAVGPLGFALRGTVAAALVLVRFRVLAAPEERIERGRLLLILLLLPTLMQFQFAGGRINGDGLMYYVYVRSLWKDFDLDFANEYTHYGLIDRADLAVPTSTGLRRSIFSIGPAVAWTPFFALGEGVARLQVLLGGSADLSGYGPVHRNAVALGSLFYGFAAVLLVYELLRRHFAASTALGAALLVWGTTFLYWYMVQQPTMSHAASTGAAALALWLWDAKRGRRDLWGFAVLGLVLGLAMCIRWQNGVLLVLPGLELLGRLRDEPGAWRRRAAEGSVLLLAAGIGAFPQMAAWKALYDMWILPYPPQGIGYVRLDHPFVLQTLFSSRHGLLSWTPVFWAGFVGFVPLIRRQRALGLALLVPLVLMTYVNMCAGDWWGGGAFSNRRFGSLIPILAFGFAASIDGLRDVVRRRPGGVLAAAALPVLVWNVLLVEQVRQGSIRPGETHSFPRLVEHGAEVFSRAVGSPTTWPASWLFAWTHGRPPSQFDRLVGRYLFYRNNNMRGHIDVGGPDDEAMLGEGWGPVERLPAGGARRLRGPARLFVPLDVPADLDLLVRGRAAPENRCEIAVGVNGHVAGALFLGADGGEGPLRLAARLWKREINELRLDPGSCEVLVDALDFEPVGSGS